MLRLTTRYVVEGVTRSMVDNTMGYKCGLLLHQHQARADPTGGPYQQHDCYDTKAMLQRRPFYEYNALLYFTSSMLLRSENLGVEIADKLEDARWARGSHTSPFRCREEEGVDGEGEGAKECRGLATRR